MVPLTQSPEELDEILTSTGLEIEHFENIENIKGGLRNLVVGEVISCEKHPNADKLKLTKVDIGSGELLSIVCGAPNVAAGLKVIVAPVGTTVHPVNGEPFKIQKAKIRGEQSEGMLCAEDEIGLGESHEGLKILDSGLKNGTPLTELYQVESDVIFEIGLTANRGDAASHYGVARELSAVLGIPLHLHTSELNMKGHQELIKIKVDSADDCPRYSGIIIKGIQVSESPEWLQNRLKSIGLKPINNIVDTTNYILHELGQPLHAFDLSKIKGGEIHVGRAIPDEVLTTLDGVNRKLKGHELMIRDTEHPLCMAGVYGGIDSGVSDATTSIFLESAYFSPDLVRKTAKTHGISTDSSFRFERGTDPEMTLTALKRAAAIIAEIAGGEVISMIDVYPQTLNPFEIELKFSNVRKILGIDIPVNRVREILTGLGIEIKAENEISMQLSVPRFKSDVTREIDVIEELIRIHGFKHIPLQQHLRMSLNYNKGNDSRAVEKKISDLLRGMGYREIMTNSLTSDKYYPENEQLVRIANPLSAEMNIMRQSMIFGALEAIAYNKNRKQNNTHFFEFGRVYKTKENGFSEKEQLLIIASGKQTEESWETAQKTVDIHHIHSVIKRLGTAFGIENPKAETGSIDKKTLSAFGIKDEVYFAVLDWSKLSNKREFKLEAVPELPSVRRDLSLVLDKSVRFEQIQKIISKNGSKKITSVNVFDVYEGKPLENHQKAVSVSIELYDSEKTLTEQEIEPVIGKLIGEFEKELNALIRK